MSVFLIETNTITVRGGQKTGSHERRNDFDKSKRENQRT
jgi:hypothetical protein